MPTLGSAIIQSAGLRPGASGIMFQSDNAADIGATAANRPRDFHLGRNAVIGGALTVVGTQYIGDTANAKSTLGLTVNQAGADDEIVSLKSSDVDHGMTDQSETDTFGSLSKASGANGGCNLIGYTEATSALGLVGLGVTDNTAKTTAGRGYVNITAAKKSGTGVTSPGADANLATIQDAATGNTRFIFDVEGSGHADVEWVAF